MHHVKDAHEWHLWGPEHGGTSIYLPVIIYDGGLKMFSSRHFYHGSEGTQLTIKHTKHFIIIKELDPQKVTLCFMKKYISLIIKINFNLKINYVHGNTKPFDVSITKNVVSLFVGSLLLFLIMFSAARFYKKWSCSTKRNCKVYEPLIIFVRDDIAKENIKHNKHHRYVPT